MQSYSQTGITGTVEITSTQLGYDPADYTHHMVQVGNLDSGTWALQIRLPGASVWATIGANTNADGDLVSVGPEYVTDAFRVTFSGGAMTAAQMLVGSLSRSGSLEI